MAIFHFAALPASSAQFALPLNFMKKDDRKIWQTPSDKYKTIALYK